MSIGSSDKQAVTRLWNHLYRPISESATVAEAAQALTAAFFKEHAAAVKLVRLFATIPYRDLPDRNRLFAAGLAARLGATAELSEETSVLSLLGTSGAMEAWNDRYRSAGHLAIPLTSEKTVSVIPMLNRMLSDLALDLSAPGGAETDKGHRSFAGGIFHLPDARTATDILGRNIIPDQAFVERYAIRSVFGLGGRYQPLPRRYLVFVCFCKADVERAAAAQYGQLINLFITTTARLAERNAYY